MVQWQLQGSTDHYITHAFLVMLIAALAALSDGWKAWGHWRGRVKSVLAIICIVTTFVTLGYFRQNAIEIEMSQPYITDAAIWVTGVMVENGGAMEIIPAAAVVISDGGFQANMKLMRRYVSPAPQKLLQRGAATGHGDGLMMAEAAGAKLVGMDRFYGHLLGRQAFEIEKLWPYPIVDPIAAHSIVVDEAGRRFLDEGMGGVYMANEVAKLDNPLTATVVFDDAVWNGLAADNRYPPCMNPVFVNAGGTVLEAGDLDTLAKKAGISADGLSATVVAYNVAIQSGAAHVPVRTVTKFKPQPIAQLPFRAIPVCAGITYTMGGIAIDRDSRVQAQSGEVIPGLFAAGSASGGIEGGRNAAYLGGLTKAVITGLRAAESAAYEAQAAA